MRTDFFRSLFQDDYQPHAVKDYPRLDDDKPKNRTIRPKSSNAPQRKILSKSNDRVVSETTSGKAPALSADEFLTRVTKGLRVGVTELLRLEVITQQDIDDLNAGMYSAEHIEDYRALVEQQLKLKLVSGG